MSAALSLNDTTARPKGRRHIAQSPIDLAPFAVRTEAQYRRAIGMLNGTVALDHPGRGQRDFVDIMIPVVEAYEAQHHRTDISGITPLALLRSLLADHAMTASDLGRLLGNRSVGGAILRGERELRQDAHQDPGRAVQTGSRGFHLKRVPEPNWLSPCNTNPEGIADQSPGLPRNEATLGWRTQ